MAAIIMYKASEKKSSEAGQDDRAGAAQYPGDPDRSTARPFRLCRLSAQLSQHRRRRFARHFPELLDQEAGALIDERVTRLSRRVDSLRRRCRGAVSRGFDDPLDRLQRVCHGRIADGRHLEDGVAFVDENTLLPQRLPQLAGIHHTTRSICGQMACLILNSRDF